MTWDDIIDKADSERFVGREQELFNFRVNIIRKPPRYLIYYITGQGGVGKTTLLHRYREIAEEEGFLLADCDEQQQTVPAVLGRFARQLAELGLTLKRFDERYRLYRQKMDEIEHDLEAPQGFAAMLGKSLVRGSYVLGDLVPGLRKGLDYLPQDVVETQASEWATYLAKKLINKDEVALLRNPVSILTPLFFKDLNEIAERRHILLCFDNFEAASDDLHTWLTRLREYKPAQNVRIVIAGREAPGASWDPLRGVTFTIPLDVFTEQEALQFLDTYGIFDEQRRSEILEFSGTLPVLMSWLASPAVTEPYIVSPAGDIVDRFLRWVTDVQLRRITLLMAIPRTFDRDIVEILLAHSNLVLDPQNTFQWLRTMPFVQPRVSGWQYHPVVRRYMLQYQAQESSQTYRGMNAWLATFYNNKLAALALSSIESWASEHWRQFTLEYAYHHLIAAPDTNWPDILSIFTIALVKRTTFAQDLLNILQLLIKTDELSTSQRDDIRLFSDQLAIIFAGRLEQAYLLFDKLCTTKGLSSEAQIYALTYRGKSILTQFERAMVRRGPKSKEQLERALSDFDDALSIDSDIIEALLSRADVYHQIGRHEDAVADINHVLSIDEKNIDALRERISIYIELDRFKEALEDANRALTFDARNIDILGTRATIYSEMEHYNEALADATQALNLASEDWDTFILRSNIYQAMGDYESAISDLKRAYRLIQPQQAKFKGTVLIINFLFGNNYFSMKRYEEALKWYTQAIALKPTSVFKGREQVGWSVLHLVRSEVYDELQRYAEALADINRAIELEASDIPARYYAQRAAIYVALDNNIAALSDLDLAITQESNNIDWVRRRAQAYVSLSRFDQGIAELVRLIEQNPEDFSSIYVLAWSYYVAHYYQDSLRTFDRALELEPDNVRALNRRGAVLQSLGRYQEALEVFNGLIVRQNSKEPDLLDSRALVYVELGCYEEALVDFRRAISIDSKSIDYTVLGLTYSYLGRYLEAIKSYKIDLQKHKDQIEVLYNIATATIRWKGLNQSKTQINIARKALLAAIDSNTDGHALYGLGGLAALEGNVDQAMQYLRRALTINPEIIRWLVRDIAWQHLHSNPLFQSILAEVPQSLTSMSHVSKNISDKNRGIVVRHGSLE